MCQPSNIDVKLGCYSYLLKILILTIAVCELRRGFALQCFHCNSIDNYIKVSRLSGLQNVHACVHMQFHLRAGRGAAHLQDNYIRMRMKSDRRSRGSRRGHELEAHAMIMSSVNVHAVRATAGMIMIINNPIAYHTHSNHFRNQTKFYIIIHTKMLQNVITY